MILFICFNLRILEGWSIWWIFFGVIILMIWFFLFSIGIWLILYFWNKDKVVNKFWFFDFLRVIILDFMIFLRYIFFDKFFKLLILLVEINLIILVVVNIFNKDICIFCFGVFWIGLFLIIKIYFVFIGFNNIDG